MGDEICPAQVQKRENEEEEEGTRFEKQKKAKKSNKKDGFKHGASRKGIAEVDNGVKVGDIKNTFGYLITGILRAMLRRVKATEWWSKGNGKNFELGFNGEEIGLNTGIGEVIAAEKFNEGQDNRMRDLGNTNLQKLKKL